LPLKSDVHLPLRLRCDKPSEMKWWPPFTSEQTVLGHGIYLAAIALVLLFAPGLVRAFLQFPAELDWWNRVLKPGRFMHRQRLGEIATAYQPHRRDPLIRCGDSGDTRRHTGGAAGGSQCRCD